VGAWAHGRHGDEQIRVAGRIRKWGAACLHRGLLRLPERCCVEAFQGVPVSRLSPATLVPNSKSFGASGKPAPLGWSYPAQESTMSLLSILGELGFDWQLVPQLGPQSFTKTQKTHKKPHILENDSPKGPCWLLFSPLHACFSGDTRLVTSPWKGDGAMPGTSRSLAWLQHHLPFTLGAFSFSSKLVQDPGGISQVTLHK